MYVVFGRKVSILLTEIQPNGSTHHYKFFYSYFKLTALPPHYRNQPLMLVRNISYLSYQTFNVTASSLYVNHCGLND